MKIKTALILCAGYGKRLSPLTLTEPKPLLKVDEITLLENCINLIQFLRVVLVLLVLMDLTSFHNQHTKLMQC